MNAPDQFDNALDALAETTAELARAAELGEFDAANLALIHRQAQLAVLETALGSANLTRRQLDLLDQLVRQGDIVAKSLVGRRETTRAQIAELECLRRQLAGWISAPAAPALDVSL